MTAALTKPKSGFGVSRQTPQQIIKGMCQREVLRPQNIDAYVLDNREEYDADYPYREQDLSSHPLNCSQESPNSKVDIKGWHHGANKPMFQRYAGTHGLWHLTAIHYPTDGYTDFSVCANIGDYHTFHKLEAKNNIIRVYGEDVYKEWRRRVIDTYDESIAWLMNDISEKCPGLKAYSITTCESAERLMARTPNVYLHRKVAFLIVPEK
jgi:hypothetical protein